MSASYSVWAGTARAVPILKSTWWKLILLVNRFNGRFCFIFLKQGLCHSSCPETNSVDHTGLELRDLPACLQSALIKGMCHHACKGRFLTTLSNGMGQETQAQKVGVFSMLYVTSQVVILFMFVVWGLGNCSCTRKMHILLACF